MTNHVIKSTGRHFPRSCAELGYKNVFCSRNGLVCPYIRLGGRIPKKKIDRLHCPTPDVEK